MSVKPKIPRSGKEQGVVMIEALIAILLFSLGVLALVGLQGVMTKNVTQSKYRGEASFLANQLIGQMWVDQANLANYAIASNACTTASNTKCTNWLSTVGQTLPGGGAKVNISGSAIDITLTWQMPGESVPHQFQIDANITN